MNGSNMCQPVNNNLNHHSFSLPEDDCVFENYQNPRVRDELPRRERQHESSREGNQNNNLSEFWVNRPSILWQKNHLTEFYPHRGLDYHAQYNALSRFVIYLGVLMYLYSGDLSSFIITFLGLLLVAWLWRLNLKDSQLLGGQSNCNGNGGQEPANKGSRSRGGVANSNCTIFDSNTNTNSNSNSNSQCQGPTRENPFMNILVTDYVNHPHRKPACSLLNREIQSEVRDLYNDRLYLEVDDIWEKRNGQREFITQPNTTIPNDQEGFARWLFDNPNHSCRENYICKNDLRFNNAGPSPSEMFKDIC